MTRTRAQQLRGLLGEVDAKILHLIDQSTVLSPGLVTEIGALETARTALWRLLTAEEAQRCGETPSHGCSGVPGAA